MRTYIAAKLHDLRVTEANLDYIGSVTIDAVLLDHVGIDPYEQIDIVNLHNGARWTTYALAGEADSGIFTLNGGGARLGLTGDRCVIMAYRQADHFPGASVAFVNEQNKIIRDHDYAPARP